MNEKRIKKLKFVIIILIILLVISVSALTGTLLYNYFVYSKPATVEVPGNIITPESESSADMGQRKPSDEPSSEPSDSSQTSSSDAPSSATELTAEASVGGTEKPSAIYLHNKHPEENNPFRVTNMFPGDKETEYFRIKVYYKGDIIVRYHADIRPGYEKPAEVMKVKIRMPETGETLYDGLIRDMPQSLDHKLYTTEKTQSELYYEITAYLDTSVGNDYQDKELIADFRWWVEETDNLDYPQTGDTSNIYLWICLAAGSFIAVIILIAKRRKETSDEY